MSDLEIKKDDFVFVLEKGKKGVGQVVRIDMNSPTETIYKIEYLRGTRNSQTPNSQRKRLNANVVIYRYKDVHYVHGKDHPLIWLNPVAALEHAVDKESEADLLAMYIRKSTRQIP